MASLVFILFNKQIFNGLINLLGATEAPILLIMIVMILAVLFIMSNLNWTMYFFAQINVLIEKISERNPKPVEVKRGDGQSKQHKKFNVEYQRDLLKGGRRYRTEAEHFALPAVHVPRGSAHRQRYSGAAAAAALARGSEFARVGGAGPDGGDAAGAVGGIERSEAHRDQLRNRIGAAL